MLWSGMPGKGDSPLAGAGGIGGDNIVAMAHPCIAVPGELGLCEDHNVGVEVMHGP